MKLSRPKKSFGIALLLLLSILIWIKLIQPKLLSLSPDFYYQADIVSSDNFYDENTKMYKGPIVSKASYYYKYAAKQDSTHLIKNVFDVKTPAGEPIFAVERLYAINPETRAHVPELGDRERTGFLFAPRHVNKQDFDYWHINYDAPAHMQFKNEETIEGLKVYRYEAEYKVDQTENLGNLPDVPELRGVDNDVHLQLWVEPVTGWLVKYQDNTVAYYYNQQTKERMSPWNKFSNHFSDSSVTAQVNEAKSRKQLSFIVEHLAPILLGFAALISLAANYTHLVKKPRGKK